MKDIVPIKNLVDRANFFANASISPATRKAYESDWSLFHDFCQKYELESLPAEPTTVCLYLSKMADDKATVSTITRRCTSITAIHNAAGHDSPCKTDKVGRVLKGIRKKLGTAPAQSKAISWSQLNDMVSQCDTMILGLRDAAILALGWTSALRRSELVALNIGDIEFVKEGLIVNVRRSKTDQEGKGVQIGIPSSDSQPLTFPGDPVRAVKRWIERRETTKTTTNFKTLPPDAPLFTKIGVNGRNKWWCETSERLSARMVSEIVKIYVKLIGLNPNLYSAHSLRRGLATEAGGAGVPERIISRHTRHVSMKVLREYIEAGTIWAENPLHAVYSAFRGE